MKTPTLSEQVSRRRYEREKKARQEAEKLLDDKSRALWEANQKLTSQADALERTVTKRTAELNKAMQAAQASNQAKSIFLASMSHEIRTPLNGVLGMAEALSETSLSSEQAEMAATIVESGGILLSVLNDILDVSKIEAGQMEIENIPFDLSALFAATKQLYALKAAEKNLVFDIHLSPAAQTWITGDPVRLRQVAGNLISNAIKFTANGHVLVDVDLVQADQGLKLIVRVTDSGTGISKHKLDDLFQPFNQLDPSVNREYGGTGLGLAISRQICNLMNGDIRVESEFGTGSVFTATFSVAPAKTVETALPQTDQHSQEILASQKWRILVAEDNRTNQLVLSKQLKDFDLDLTFVGNGQLAVDSALEGEYDMILMDINMPHMGGVDATINIRHHETCLGRAAIPIIALTANSMTHQITGYLASGMNGHLSKPLKKAILLRTLADTLQPTAQKKAPETKGQRGL